MCRPRCLGKAAPRVVLGGGAPFTHSLPYLLSAPCLEAAARLGSLSHTAQQWSCHASSLGARVWLRLREHARCIALSSSAELHTRMSSPSLITCLLHGPYSGRNNLALKGGAIYLQEFGFAEIEKMAFVQNTAQMRVEVDGRTYDRSETAGLAGAGGAIYTQGKPLSSAVLRDVSFLQNSAVDGGALYVGPAVDCKQQEGCYTVELKNVAMSGNTAKGGGGGAVYWTYPKVLNISSCPADGIRAQMASRGMAELSDFELPCANWEGNTVTDGGHGPVLASTPFYLTSPVRIDGYTSYYADVPVNVTVNDYFGQLCSGDVAQEPLIVDALNPKVTAAMRNYTSSFSASSAQVSTHPPSPLPWI